MKLDPNPELHSSDNRIQVILSLMQSAAFSLGELLTQVFPGASNK